MDDDALFAEIIEKLKRQSKIPDDDKIKGIQFYLVAKNDLEISKFLYSHNFYASATYHLQQCYEKLVKSFYILSGTTSPESVYGHDYVMKRLSRLLDEDWFKFGLQLNKYLGETDIDVKNQVADLANISPNEVKVLPKETIKLYFTLFTNFENKLLSDECIEKSYSKVTQKKKINKIKHILFLITRFRVSESDVYDNISRQKIIDITEDVVLSMKLMFFGVLTMYHFNEPRYPIGKDFKLNYFMYKPSLGIIDSMPEFLDITAGLFTAYEKRHAETIKMYNDHIHE